MILNPYAVLSAFVVVLRGIAALLVIGLACRILRNRRLALSSPIETHEQENHAYLLFLLSTWLLALNLISWPMLYLLLQSYVPHWPGVMCIFGVTQIGIGSSGTSRFLPTLITATQCLKPAVVFVSGLWWTLYGLHRHAPRASLLGKLLWIQFALGGLALADVAIEGAYLAIPKKEEFLFTGCCTTGLDASTVRSASWLGELSRRLGPEWLSMAYYCANLGVLLLLWRLRRRGGGTGLCLVLLSAVLILPLTMAYFVEIAAPVVLHLPYHHCLYDLVPKAPDLIVALLLAVTATFCVGWANAVHWLANPVEFRSVSRSVRDRLIVIAANCYAGLLVMTFLEVHLA